MEETQKNSWYSKVGLKGKGPKWAVIGVILFVLLDMWVNSKKPAIIESVPYDKSVKGSAFVNANLVLLDQMISNWLPNDRFWPTVFLDNMPNFQLGQLELVRYNIRNLRDRLSRMRATDKLDPFAEKAFTALSNDPLRWWFPSAESKWKEARKLLLSYMKGLEDGSSQFFPRADNLAELFQDYSFLLGGVNTRLLNAARGKGIVKEAMEATEGQGQVEVSVPWYKVDNNFYYAQGVAYALHATLLAIKIDFMETLVKKNCMSLLDSILEDLRRSYFEPLVVFNGDLDSIFANHCLNLSSIIADGKQKMDAIIVTLTKG